MMVGRSTVLAIASPSGQPSNRMTVEPVRKPPINTCPRA